MLIGLKRRLVRYFEIIRDGKVGKSRAIIFSSAVHILGPIYFRIVYEWAGTLPGP
jgi:hypothetical protein